MHTGTARLAPPHLVRYARNHGGSCALGIVGAAKGGAVVARSAAAESRVLGGVA